MIIHACVNLKHKDGYTGMFKCYCGFMGNLDSAIKHTLQNQFIVESKPRARVPYKWIT